MFLNTWIPNTIKIALPQNCFLLTDENLWENLYAGLAVGPQLFYKESRYKYRRCSIKKVFLKFSLNSQENICAKVLL